MHNLCLNIETEKKSNQYTVCDEHKYIKFAITMHTNTTDQQHNL